MINTLIQNFDLGIVAYFLSLNVIYSMLLVVATVSIIKLKRRRANHGLVAMEESLMMPGVSLIVPGYNEEPVIVESILSMLDTTYPSLEVIVVNDGSKDRTLERMKEAFELVAIGRVPLSALPSKAVKGVYVSRTDPRIVVIDKENGGKADALNCGINYARNPLVCATDADTLLDDQVLMRLARPIALDPERTIGTGGTIRVANGSIVESGEVVEARVGDSFLATLQAVEYLRAFLVSRTGWASINAMLIVSGALGMFKRDIVVEVGGYDLTTVGEDAELVFRLHRKMREEKRDYRIEFVPDAICWTQAPDSFKVLRRQRDRWHRGLLEVLWRHRDMIASPRYGAIGMLAAPYFLLFEAIGPLIELSGVIAACFAAIVGALAWNYVIAFGMLSLFWGMILTIGSLALEEHAYHRYKRWRCLWRLLVASVVENFGHRQVLAAIRAYAFVTLLRNKNQWGEMTRATFQGEKAPETVRVPIAVPVPSAISLGAGAPLPAVD